MIIPPTWLAAGGLALAVVGFAGGYKVREWQCEAQVAKIERAAEKARARNQSQAEKQATNYEEERSRANETTTIREREIRTKYVPGSCDPGPDVGRVLDNALRDANGAASGEPRSAVPEPAS